MREDASSVNAPGAPEPHPPRSVHSLISLRRAVLGTLAFLFLTTAGIALVIRWKAPGAIDATLATRLGVAMILLLPLTALDSLLGGIRYRVFFDGKTLPFVSLWNCMCSNWANVCLGAITPSQTGGGPAQVYILCRSGAKASQAILVALLNGAWTFGLFLVGSLVLLTLHPSNVFHERVSSVLNAAVVGVTLLLVVLVLSFVFPDQTISALRKLGRVVPARFRRRKKKRAGAVGRVESELRTFREGTTTIFRKRRSVLGLSALATLALFCNKYLIGLVVARALQGEIPVLDVLSAQFVQHLLVYFAPTPGASGVAEVSSAWLMGDILEPRHHLLYAVLWRFFTTIFGAILGGVVLISSLYGLTRRPASKAGSAPRTGTAQRSASRSPRDGVASVPLGVDHDPTAGDAGHPSR